MSSPRWNFGHDSSCWRAYQLLPHQLISSSSPLQTAACSLNLLHEESFSQINQSSKDSGRTTAPDKSLSDWVSERMHHHASSRADFSTTRRLIWLHQRTPPPSPTLNRANRVWLWPFFLSTSGSPQRFEVWQNQTGRVFNQRRRKNPVFEARFSRSERRLLRGYVRLLVTQTCQTKNLSRLKSLLIKYRKPSSSLPSLFSLLSFHVNLHPAPGLRPGSVGIQSICWDY